MFSHFSTRLGSLWIENRLVFADAPKSTPVVEPATEKPATPAVGPDTAAKKAQKDCDEIVRDSKRSLAKVDSGNVTSEQKTRRDAIDRQLMPIIGLNSEIDPKTKRHEPLPECNPLHGKNYAKYKKEWKEYFKDKPVNFVSVTIFHEEFLKSLERLPDKRLPDMVTAAPAAPSGEIKPETIVATRETSPKKQIGAMAEQPKREFRLRL